MAISFVILILLTLVIKKSVTNNIIDSDGIVRNKDQKNLEQKI